MSKPIRFFIVRQQLWNDENVWPWFGQEAPTKERIIEELKIDSPNEDFETDYLYSIEGPYEVPGGARYPRDWKTPEPEWKKGLPKEVGTFWIYCHNLRDPKYCKIRYGSARLSGNNKLMVIADGTFFYEKQWRDVVFFHKPASPPEPPEIKADGYEMVTEAGQVAGVDLDLLVGGAGTAAGLLKLGGKKTT